MASSNLVMAVFSGGYSFCFYFGLLRFFLRDMEGYYVTVVSFMLPYSRDHGNNVAKGLGTNML